MTEEDGVTTGERDSCASAEASDGTLSATLGMTVEAGMTGGDWVTGDSVGAGPSLSLGMTEEDGVTTGETLETGEIPASAGMTREDGMTGEDAGMTGSAAGTMTAAGAAVAPVPPPVSKSGLHRWSGRSTLAGCRPHPEFGGRARCPAWGGCSILMRAR